MEERIIDKDEERKIKLKRTADGETDAVEDDGEVIVDLPEGDEYDEDLVGLTPSQLKEELERRERARQAAKKECEKFVAEGNELLAKGDFSGAEEAFAQACLFDEESEDAAHGLWIARTHDFSDLEPVYREDCADDLEKEMHRAFLLSRAESEFRTAREEYAREEAELAPVYEAGQAERREAFSRNKSYYLLRFGIFLALTVLCIVGIAVSASYLLRTTSSLPVVFTAVFGALTFVFLAVFIVFARKLIVAQRLCRANERLGSTEDGARLAFLRGRLQTLARLFGEE